jgi:RNA polymerase sigma factor (sigma-70 family)
MDAAVMRPGETEIGGPGRYFPPTSVALIRSLRASGSRRYNEAVTRLYSLYWKPVYCLIRSKGARSNEDAKDLTEEFFVNAVLEGTLIDSYSSDKGSFRVYLRAAVSNFVRDWNRTARRQKRGGGAHVFSLQFEEDANLPEDRSALTPEEAFDAAWKDVVRSRALALTEKRLRAEEKQLYFEVFRSYTFESDITYQKIGDELNLTPVTVKNYLKHARKEFQTAVKDVMSEYVETPDGLSAEMKELFGV